MRRPNGSANQELMAFHAAMLRLQKETNTTGQLIPLQEWEAMLCRTLGSQGILMTPQSCKDKTWFLERLGLIQRKPREGIILMEVQP